MNFDKIVADAMTLANSQDVQIVPTMTLIPSRYSGVVIEDRLDPLSERQQIRICAVHRGRTLRTWEWLNSEQTWVVANSEVN